MEPVSSLSESAAPEVSGIVKAKHTKAARVRVAATDQGWRAVGWFGALLAIIGLSDVALYWYPVAFGSPEWEFGTVATSFGALPLATIGLAAVVGALVVNRARVPMMAVAGLLLVLALFVAGAYLLFLKNMPLAFSATDGPQAVAMYRGVARTTVKGLGFGSAYLIAAITLLRNLPLRVES